MLTHPSTDTYTNLLDRSIHNAWTVEDCFQDRDFDFTKSFVPERIAGWHSVPPTGGGGLRSLGRRPRRSP